MTKQYGNQPNVQTIQQVNIYLENPDSCPLPTKTRTKIDFIALKRVPFKEYWTCDDIKEKFFEMSHAPGYPSDYELHLVEALDDKKLIYGSFFFSFLSFFFFFFSFFFFFPIFKERVLLPDEKIFDGIKPKKGERFVFPQYLMVKKGEKQITLKS